MINTADLFLLCSSHPDVHEFYAEQMRDLFTAVSGLGGILAISGCEGWLHCHTANQPDTCPICAGKDIEKETAKMYNAMAKAVKKEPTEIPPLFQYANPHRSAWATSLSFVTPFGVNAVLKALKKMRSLMEKGCAFLPDNAGFHGAVCRMFLCYIRTAYNMTDFFRLRDSFYWAPYSPEQALVKVQAMRQIAREELENTKEAMKILEEYPEIAFSYTYRHGISMEQCEWKVKHTEQLIDHDLPAFYYGATFGRHLHPVWLD